LGRSFVVLSGLRFTSVACLQSESASALTRTIGALRPNPTRSPWMAVVDDRRVVCAEKAHPRSESLEAEFATHTSARLTPAPTFPSLYVGLSARASTASRAWYQHDRRRGNFRVGPSETNGRRLGLGVVLRAQREASGSRTTQPSSGSASRYEYYCMPCNAAAQPRLRFRERWLCTAAGRG
jgi:hypothetical protein